MFISQFIRNSRVCSSYECFILRAARLSFKLLEQGYDRGRLKSSLRKFYCRYRDLIKHYEVPLSQMFYGILGHDHIQWHPTLIRHFTKSWPCYNTRPFYRFWRHFREVFIWHLQLVRLANRGCLLIGTPSPVLFGTCICSNIETIRTSTFHVYGPFEFRTSLDTSILLLWKCQYEKRLLLRCIHHFKSDLINNMDVMFKVRKIQADFRKRKDKTEHWIWAEIELSKWRVQALHVKCLCVNRFRKIPSPQNLIFIRGENPGISY